MLSESGFAGLRMIFRMVGGGVGGMGTQAARRRVRARVMREIGCGSIGFSWVFLFLVRDAVAVELLWPWQMRGACVFSYAHTWNAGYAVFLVSCGDRVSSGHRAGHVAGQ